MKNPKNIYGSGFGGSKSSSPEPPETEEISNKSTSRAFVVELLSEGEIEGLVDGAKGIYLDDTPVQDEDGEYNFTGFRYSFRPGRSNQGLLRGFADEITSEIAVGVDLEEENERITRSIINPELDAIRLRLQIALQRIQENGDIDGDFIEFKIETKQGNDAWQVRKNLTIKGRYPSPTEFEYQFRVDNQGGTVQDFGIRVTRVTPATSHPERVIRSLQFVSFTEVSHVKLNYKNSAVIGLIFDAEQFNSIPRRGYAVYGRTVRIPSNATVNDDGSLDFSGQWDGSFVIPSKACSDPVWQLYDVLTNDRYGLRKYFGRADIDRWALYEASVHNNQRVPDGYGGYEKRYTCTTVLQAKQRAYDVINYFCSACHLKPFWSNGMLTFWQDRPGEVVRQFTNADVLDGQFKYSETALRTRYTDALVTWNNPDNAFRREVEPVSFEDFPELKSIPQNTLEIAAYGACTRGLAARFGRWALFSSQFETQTVTFNCRSWSALVRPGEIVQIMDNRKSSLRYGGLVKDGDFDRVELDQAVDLRGYNNSVTVLMGDGKTQTRPVVSPPGFRSALLVDPPFNQRPRKGSNWILQNRRIQAQTWRVLSVVPDMQDPSNVEITCLRYLEEKYDYIERDILFDPDEFRNLNSLVKKRVRPPTKIQIGFNEMIDPEDNIKRYSLIASWERPNTDGRADPEIVGYAVEYKRNNRNTWQDQTMVPKNSTDHQFDGLLRGNYKVRVASVDRFGRKSKWRESNVLSVGRKTTSLSYRFNSKDLSLRRV